MAVDQLGRIYTTDAVADRVQVFDASGNFLLKFGETGLGNGQFDNPRALTIDSKGRIIVTDASNRIQVFSLDSDEDGVADQDDNCADSNLDDTVHIDGCDSGVANPVFSDGCTLADLVDEIVAECVDGAKNHGQFVSCFAKGANGLKKDGLITGDDKDALQSCAAQSSLP